MNASPAPGGWYRAAQVVANGALDVLLVREITGLAHVPDHGGVIVAANHGSFWDPPVLGATIRRPLTYLTRAAFFDVPGFAGLIRSLGAIPIRRGVADHSGLDRAVRALETGHALLVFPEGGRMKDGRLHPALPGLGYLVSRTRVPVVPVYLSGTNRIRRCMVRRDRVRITFGEALPATLWPPAAEESTRSGRDRHRSIGDRVMQEIGRLRREQEEAARNGAAPVTASP